MQLVLEYPNLTIKDSLGMMVNAVGYCDSVLHPMTHTSVKCTTKKRRYTL